MLKISETEVVGWRHAIRGMRNALNSWDKSDSEWDGYGSADGYSIGRKDHDLMMRLREAGTDHHKYMRMIVVYLDIDAPLYWWKEFDTYKVGTVANSCSTMHTIHKKEFTSDDFSHEHLDVFGVNQIKDICRYLNTARIKFLANKDKDEWWQIIQLLPTSFNQKRTVMLNYEVLANIYKSRKNHKLDEWHTFCHWIEELPYSEFITGYFEEEPDDN